jgi:hypothetical protein
MFQDCLQLLLGWKIAALFELLPFTPAGFDADRNVLGDPSVVLRLGDDRLKARQDLSSGCLADPIVAQLVTKPVDHRPRQPRQFDFADRRFRDVIDVRAILPRGGRHELASLDAPIAPLEPLPGRLAYGDALGVRGMGPELDFALGLNEPILGAALSVESP